MIFLFYLWLSVSMFLFFIDFIDRLIHKENPVNIKSMVYITLGSAAWPYRLYKNLKEKTL